MSTPVERIGEFNKFGSVLGLERMNKLLELLGNPQEKLRVIHVAGTNGKGSICQYIYRALQANGYKTGLYISPFIENFNERIQFNGRYISEQELEEFADLVIGKADEMVSGGLDSPTEFEIVTAIAIAFFAHIRADVVILEVGLGGSGDSTNVVKMPIMTIIGSISYDHTDRLGSTIEEIAADKAGIIKKNVPLVTAVERHDAKEVIANYAAGKNATLIDSLKFKPYNLRESIYGSHFSADILGEAYQIELSMGGFYQITNSIAALTSLEYMRQENIIRLNKEGIIKGMAIAKNPGRMEVISREPLILLDGAHNVGGAEALKEAVIAEDGLKEDDILIVTGVLKDKDIKGIFGELRKICKNFIVTTPDNHRKANPNHVARVIHELGGNGIVAEDVRSAIDMAVEKLEKGEYKGLIVVGSLYLIGEVRRILCA